MKNLTDIFFDLDHTLWDFDRNSKLAFGRMFDHYGLDMDLDAFMEIYMPINYGFWKQYREGEITKKELRERRFTQVFENFGYDYSARELVEMEAHYIKELPNSNHLFEGTKEILTYLQHSYRLHIITNGFHEVQDKKLSKSGIDHHFATVTTSEEAGNQKPHPSVFKLAMSKAGTDASRSVMIGDTFEADIIGAEGVGMQSIYFNGRNEEIPAGYRRIDQLIELKQLL